MAESQGFEPWVRLRTQHFECCTIDHSDNSPKGFEFVLLLFDQRTLVSIHENQAGCNCFVADTDRFPGSPPNPHIDRNTFHISEKIDFSQFSMSAVFKVTEISHRSIKLCARELKNPGKNPAIKHFFPNRGILLQIYP